MSQFTFDQLQGLPDFSFDIGPQSAVWTTKVNSAQDQRVLSQKFKSKYNKDDSQAVKPTYNHGLFTSREKQAVEQAIKKYMVEYEVPDEDLEYLVCRRSKIPHHSDPNVFLHNPYSDKKYEGFLQQVLEKSQINRSLDQLYNYCSRKYRQNKTGGKRWSPEEDNELLRLVAEKGTRWKVIERLMGKTDVKSRYKKLKHAPIGNKGPWTVEETNLFNTGVREIAAKHNLRQIQKFSYWTELSQYIGTRTDTQCRNKWMHDVQQSESLGEFTTDDYVDLLNRMTGLCQAAQDELEVNWEALVDANRPFTGSMLRQRWISLRQRVPLELEFQDMLAYCILNLPDLLK
ncbi:hypothetical protein EDD86DRAFT_209640 [Gorgonomyces haynaldii]|nr:hypothetical protein EDD86DRAFT_209640 [Gorgonomyces haynaldii]